MHWVRSLWNIVRGWFSPRQTPLRTVKAEDLPEHINPREIYLIGEGDYLWFVAMLCPCGCGDSVQLNLVSKVRPMWKVIQHDDGTITIEPSVWRKKGCQSHFFVRHGLIVWCSVTLSQ